MQIARILPQTVTRLHSRVVLVIDVIRATTSIVTLFERGAHAITLASNVGRIAPWQLDGDSDTLPVPPVDCVPQLEWVDSAPGDIRMMWRGEA